MVDFVYFKVLTSLDKVISISIENVKGIGQIRMRKISLSFIKTHV